MSRAGSVAEDPGELAMPWPGETVASGLMKGLPNIKIRTFSGDREDYEDWRREVETLQFLYGVSEAKLALWRMDKIWAVLDREYVRPSYQKEDLVQSKYDGVRRCPYQYLQEYLKELRACRRRLEKENSGTTIFDVSYSRKMLHCSGLNPNEQGSVLAAAGASWKASAIEAAVLLMHGDAHTQKINVDWQQ
eukprot:4111548-Amphidinium_carterae.1